MAAMARQGWSGGRRSVAGRRVWTPFGRRRTYFLRGARVDCRTGAAAAIALGLTVLGLRTSRLPLDNGFPFQRAGRASAKHGRKRPRADMVRRCVLRPAKASRSASCFQGRKGAPVCLARGGPLRLKGARADGASARLAGSPIMSWGRARINRRARPGGPPGRAGPGCTPRRLDAACEVVVVDQGLATVLQSVIPAASSSAPR